MRAIIFLLLLILKLIKGEFVVIYVTDDLNFKLRNDLNIYESKELESVFIEIVNAKKANDIVGVIYRHPSMEMDIFIKEDKLELLLSKLNCENIKNICR